MAFTFTQSFDPRIGTMQKIFGVIYVLITLVAISLAFYVRSIGQDGYLQFFMAALFGIMALKSFYISNRVKNLLKNGVYFKAKVDSVEAVRGITVINFMAALFGIMALKSFYISNRVKNLLKNGVYFKAKVDSVEAVRGITVIKGIVEIPDFGPIYIESRLAGETPARELQRYLDERKQEFLPALVVGAQGKHPRGMFTIKCKNGHLDESSAELQDENAQKSANEQEATPNSDAAATQATETAQTPSAETAQAADNEPAKPDAEPKAESENNASEQKTESETKTDTEDSVSEPKLEAQVQEWSS